MTHFFKSMDDAYALIERSQPIRSKMLIVSGVSGLGKSTLSRKILDTYPDAKISKLRNITTRARRPGEDISQIICLSLEELERLKLQDKILAYHIWEGNGQAYGILREEAYRNDAQFYLYDTTWMGSVLKLQDMEKIKHIWLIINDDKELLRRFRQRATESEHEIQMRLKNAMADQWQILKNREMYLKNGQVDMFIEVDGLDPDQVLKRVQDAVELDRLLKVEG